MISALAFLTACLAAGALGTRKLFPTLPPLEKWAVGLAVGAFGTAWLPTALAFIPGGFALPGLALAWLAVLAVLAWARDEVSGAWAELRGLPRAAAENKAVAAGLALLFVLFAFLAWTHGLEPKADGLYSAGSAWGDVAFHAALASSLAFAENTPPEYPVFAGQRLAYPFAVDAGAALLAAGGASLPDALFLSALATLAAMLVALFALATRWGASRAVGVLAVLLFVFNGGLGFVFFLDDAHAAGGVLEHLASLDRQYAHMEDRGLFFSNLTADVLLPQRGAALGLLAFAAALLLAAHAIERKQKRGLLAAGAVLGLLPLAHPSSALALGAVLAFLLLFSWRSVKAFAATFAPAALLAAPQLAWMAPQALGSTGFAKLNIGWQLAAFSPEAFLGFWLWNWGFLLPIAFWAAMRAGKETHARMAGFATLFALANLVQFQPFEWDNIKVLMYPLFGACVLAATKITQWARETKPPTKHGIGKTVRAVLLAALLLALFASGALSVHREATLSWKLYDNTAVDVAEWAKANTPARAVFLTANNHDNPIASLAGRSIVSGYPGWLWTHGIDYAQREADAKEMLAGGTRATELAAHYRVDYVLIGPAERRAGANEEYWAARGEKTFENGAYRLYAVER